jgi:hypothetical protein
VRELYPEEVEINNNIQRIDAIQRQIRTLQDEREDFPLELFKNFLRQLEIERLQIVQSNLVKKNKALRKAVAKLPPAPMSFEVRSESPSKSLGPESPYILAVSDAFWHTQDMRVLEESLTRLDARKGELLREIFQSETGIATEEQRQELDRITAKEASMQVKVNDLKLLIEKERIESTIVPQKGMDTSKDNADQAISLELDEPDDREQDRINEFEDYYMNMNDELSERGDQDEDRGLEQQRELDNFDSIREHWRDDLEPER